jgi:CRISPR-associated protein Cmr5
VREHILAERAYKAVKAVVGKDAEHEAQYRRAAEGFPALVHTNGLSHATAFFTIDKEGRIPYLTDLAGVLDINGASELHKRARTCDVESYMHLTRDVMKVAGWLKRYAQAYLKDSDSAKGQRRD